MEVRPGTGNSNRLGLTSSWVRYSFPYILVKIISHAASPQAELDNNRMQSHLMSHCHVKLDSFA